MLKIVFKRQFEAQVLRKQRRVKSARRAKPNQCKRCAGAKRPHLAFIRHFESPVLSCEAD